MYQAVQKLCDRHISIEHELHRACAASIALMVDYGGLWWTDKVLDSGWLLCSGLSRFWGGCCSGLSGMAGFTIIVTLCRQCPNSVFGCFGLCFQILWALSLASTMLLICRMFQISQFRLRFPDSTDFRILWNSALEFLDIASGLV